MGLHFIFGAAGTGKTRRCCEEIRDYVTGEKGRSAFFLVPDQETYTAERMLADIFPGHGFIDATVCGFSRLAYRVFNELRSPVQDALSPLGQQIIISRILAEHRDELQMLMKISSQPHFAENLMNLFHQLDMFCISKQRSMKHPVPKRVHLWDANWRIFLSYKNYHDYLHSRFSYEGSLFDLLAGEIPKSEILADPVYGLTASTHDTSKYASYPPYPHGGRSDIHIPSRTQKKDCPMKYSPALPIYMLSFRKRARLIPSHSERKRFRCPRLRCSQQTISKMFLLLSASERDFPGSRKGHPYRFRTGQPGRGGFHFPPDSVTCPR
ncbi:MAG: hypothetical protein ACLUIQ_04760 [Dialister invisus]